MGHHSLMPPIALAQWKIPAALLLAATLLVPAWQAHFSAPESAALSINLPLIDESNANTLIVYAAPADADPVLRISSRDTDGNWQQSEVQLSHDSPELSAKLLHAAVARELGKTQP